MFGVEQFGPEQLLTIAPKEFDQLSEEERKEEKKSRKEREASIKQGYNRILEKVKDIRHIFLMLQYMAQEVEVGKLHWYILIV